MTALEIAMAGYLAFGQLTGDYYEAITKHAGLQVVHSDGAVTLRLADAGTRVRACEITEGHVRVEMRLREEMRGRRIGRGRRAACHVGRTRGIRI